MRGRAAQGRQRRKPAISLWPTAWLFSGWNWVPIRLSRPTIAVTNGRQQADTGTKMIHLGKRTKSRIISKGISAGKSDNTYRGLVSINKRAEKSRNFTQCDSLLIGGRCGAHTVPYVENRRADAQLEHEATTTKLSEDQLFYARQRGLGEEQAVALLVNGFVREVLQELPMEFAVEAQKLLEVSLEGSVG